MKSTTSIPPLFRSLTLRLERVNKQRRHAMAAGDAHGEKVATRRHAALVNAIMEVPLP